MSAPSEAASSLCASERRLSSPLGLKAGVAVQALFNGGAWQPRRPVVALGRISCVVCGSQAPSWARLSAGACGGHVRELPPAVSALSLVPATLQVPAELRPVGGRVAGEQPQRCLAEWGLSLGLGGPGRGRDRERPCPGRAQKKKRT